MNYETAHLSRVYGTLWQKMETASRGILGLNRTRRGRHQEGDLSVRKTFLVLFTLILLFVFTSVGTSEREVSFLRETVTVDLPSIGFDIHLADGKGVAGYHLISSSRTSEVFLAHLRDASPDA